MPGFLSHANRPARVFIRSDDAIDRSGTGNPSDFNMPLLEPILEAKGVQLLSARIPNIFPQVPDYQRWFLYMITDYEGFEHVRGFRLCATTEEQRYFVNYQDMVDQLNDDCKYWQEFDMTVQTTGREYLALGLLPNTPDVHFEYDAKTRKILVKNVSPAPAANSYQLIDGLNNVFQFVWSYGSSQSNAVYIRIPPGVYTDTAALAAAMTATFSNPNNFIPLSVSSPSPGQLRYTWVYGGSPVSLNLIMNNIGNPLFPTTLAQNSALAFGLSYPFYNEKYVGAYFDSTQTIPFALTPVPPTLQLVDVEIAKQTLRVTELVKPYLYLNQILGFNVGELQPEVGVPLNGKIVPQSFGDLVRTQTIYVQSNLTLNGTFTSNGLRNVIQTIPVQVPQLGVISYQSSQAHYIWNVPNNITGISIRLIDENGQPLPLHLNAQTEFEIGFLYDDSDLPQFTRK